MENAISGCFRSISTKNLKIVKQMNKTLDKVWVKAYYCVWLAYLGLNAKFQILAV
jgi:hypothetical protein